MNITGAYVSDRRKANTAARPVLVVQVDSMPVQTNPVVYRDHDGDHWTSAKYGPLIEFAAMTIAPKPILSEVPSPAAYYNLAFSDGLAPVVDVKVLFNEESLEGYWAVQLKRGRQLLKRHEVPWRLLMCDPEGQHGRTAWVPVENEPTCARNFFTEETCKRLGTNHVLITGVDYWFCPVHFKDHHARHYLARAGR